jgi:hypothetical protein
VAKISTYPQPNPPSLTDFLLGTDTSDSDNTKNFEIADVLALLGSTFLTFADNAAAITGGLAVGTLYKTATGEVRIVV